MNKKVYILEMFPYPSGKLHPGHLRNYTIGDILARYKQANQFEVLHPIGFDAFGLPAENAAIQNNQSPKEWTDKNIKQMEEELKSMNFLYDWAQSINTSNINYYKHEQQIFLDMFKNGLIYQKESYVNWDPIDQTVLANEQVENGRGWRSGAIIEKKKLKQWFVKITQYAEELLTELDNLPGWPDKVKKQQRKWIGKSNGIEIKFKISENNYIKVFTTRPETIFGASFIGIAYDHYIAELLKNNNISVKIFCEKVNLMSNEELSKEKIGIFTGLYAEHPFTKASIPIWICNFVISGYGPGAIFGCPAHDERDFEFATKYNIPIKQVIISDEFINQKQNEQFVADPLETYNNSTHIMDTNIKMPQYDYHENISTILPLNIEYGFMINSHFLNNLNTIEAKKIIIQKIKNLKIGEESVNYKLKDWGVSRQRYWGCPIPIINCKTCGPVPNENLPIELPEITNFNKNNISLSSLTEWKKTICPKCKSNAEKETDTLDTFFESSWYFLRFCDPHNTKPINKEMVQKWMPVDHYIGGVEHAVMHLLYARFFTKVLRDLKYIPSNISEPFTRLTTQGMVLHATFQKKDLSYIYPNEVYEKDEKYFHKDTHEEIIKGEVIKMSKSKKNTIELQDMIQKVGTDAMKLFIISDTNPENEIEWSQSSLYGAKRFIDKLIQTKSEVKNTKPDQDILQKTHITIKKTEQAIEEMRLNSAIAYIRELFNHFTKNKSEEIFKIIIQLLYPFIPEVTKKIYTDADLWPKYQEELTIMNEITLSVQINGKFRGTIQTKLDEPEDNIINTILESSLNKYITTIKKTIYIPNKIINIIC